jgi:hypothetical protein
VNWLDAANALLFFGLAYSPFSMVGGVVAERLAVCPLVRAPAMKKKHSILKIFLPSPKLKKNHRAGNGKLMIII